MHAPLLSRRRSMWHLSLHATLPIQRVFPAHNGERRTISEGYWKFYSLCSHYIIGPIVVQDAAPIWATKLGMPAPTLAQRLLAWLGRHPWGGVRVVLGMLVALALWPVWSLRSP